MIYYVKISSISDSLINSDTKNYFLKSVFIAHQIRTRSILSFPDFHIFRTPPILQIDDQICSRCRQILASAFGEFWHQRLSNFTPSWRRQILASAFVDFWYRRLSNSALTSANFGVGLCWFLISAIVKFYSWRRQSLASAVMDFWHRRLSNSTVDVGKFWRRPL